MNRFFKMISFSAVSLVFVFVFTNTFAEKDNNTFTYTLTIEKGLISLNAGDAPLKAILDEIGMKMEVDIVNFVPAEDKITVTFDHLELEEAIKRLSSNYVYLMDSEKAEGNITKIVVLPKGTDPDNSQAPRDKSAKVKSSRSIEQDESEKKEKKESEPFKFTFDPSKYLKEK